MTCSPFLHRLAAALGVALAAGVRADPASDVARIHREALGGAERIAALAALRLTGEVVTGEKRVRFTATAERPDRLRLEIGSASRTLIQASDGVEPPWEFDTGKWPPRYQDMPENVGRTFAADAEFDDPLVAGAPRGYQFSYAGPAEVDERKLLRVNVTRKPNQAFSLLLDAETYLILLRVERHGTADGRVVQIVTRFDDYRPVRGVLLPHKATVMTDGKVTQQTVIETIEPNPPTTAETFTRPKSAAAAPGG